MGFVCVCVSVNNAVNCYGEWVMNTKQYRQGTRTVLAEKPVPVPLCPTQTSNGLALN
jgi:hypothetical protein